MTADEAVKEMRDQCDQRYVEGRYDSAASTNDLCAWADAIAAELAALREKVRTLEERAEAEAAFVEAAKAYMAIHLHPGPDTAERHREHWPKFEAAYRALEVK